MKSKILTSLLALCGALIVSMPASADSKDTLNAYDVAFVKGTGQAGLNEVKLAELGSAKAMNPELKSCAAMLVKDHKAANAELKSLADKKGVQLSTAIDEDTAAAYKKLEKLGGAEFDTAFITHLDKDHIKSIKSFEDAQVNSTDNDLKAWVNKTVVVLKAHHEKIKPMKK